MIQEYIIKAIERTFVRAREEDLTLDEIEGLLYEEIQNEFDYEDGYNL